MLPAHASSGEDTVGLLGADLDSLPADPALQRRAGYRGLRLALGTLVLAVTTFLLAVAATQLSGARILPSASPPNVGGSDRDHELISEVQVGGKATEADKRSSPREDGAGLRQTRDLQVADDLEEGLPAETSHEKAMFRTGATVKVRSPTGKIRLCTIVEQSEGKIKIHYDGFAAMFDEWLSQHSDRIMGVIPTTVTITSTHTTTETSTTSTTTTTSTETTTTVTTTTSTTRTTTTTTTPRQYVSLFCFSLARVDNAEIQLVRLQLAKGVSIFDCDESVVFSDTRTWVSQGPTFLMRHRSERSMVLIETTVVNATLSNQDLRSRWLNAEDHIRAWQKVVEDGRYRWHDWVVKADPDTVFMPARLRAKLSGNPAVKAKADRPLYWRTCKSVRKKCIFTITLGREYGADWKIEAGGSSGDTFSVGGCGDPTGDGKKCVEHGWGDGVHMIVNQAGAEVGKGDCCNEANTIKATEMQCPQDLQEGQPGLSGALEVLSRQAVAAYGQDGHRCLLGYDYSQWGEEHFMQECLEALGVEYLDGEDMLVDQYCEGRPGNCSTSEVAFHPFPAPDAYFGCMAAAFEDLQTPELHADLLKVPSADG